MLVPIEWLKDYTDVNADIDEFCENMIMSGSNLETVEEKGKGIEGVVVGHVEKVEKHPNADHLNVCMIDVGRDEPAQIVCGAPNITAGTNVPVALPGAHVPGPLHGEEFVEEGVYIYESELRGIKSQGMVCSCSELGYDDKVVPVIHRDGIWILPEDVDAAPGTDIVKALGLDDYVVDFEITPNRPDCLCMTGMARESAATFREKLRYPDTSLKEEGDGKAEDYISVKIEKPEFCPRYIARIATDIKIEQSPWWLQKRLMHAGQRPINNIVDITNFVMLEYGQPMHAFDINTVRGGKIIVDTTAPGTVFTTLDGSERTIEEDMLMIQDAEGPIAVAGVMGGLDSEIREDTTTIIFESANFDATNNRLTAKKLGLRTEASNRYEKGIDPNLCAAAIDRACHLLEELGAGRIVPGMVDDYAKPLEPWTVDVRVARVNHVIGAEISAEEMIDIFEDLEMTVERKPGDVLAVTPPTVRLDLLTEIDFVEEVARIHGYDKLPLTIPATSLEAGQSRLWTLRDTTRNVLGAMGASEIQTYSFVSKQDAAKVHIAEGSWEYDNVEIINPLGEENSVMRTILTPGMMQTLALNYSRNVPVVKCYELGTVFGKNYINPEELPEERDALSIGLYGGGADFYKLKGMIVELLEKLGIENVKFEAVTDYGPYHPGRCARMFIENGNNIVEMGIMGEAHPDVVEEYGIGERCYIAELFFDNIEKLAKTEISYTPLPRYPAISRDIAVVVDDEVTAGSMEDVIIKNAGDMLEELKLFDVYRGEQVADGKKSLAFSFRYRSKDRTLTDKEVDAIHEKVVVKLKDEFGATLREI